MSLRDELQGPNGLVNKARKKFIPSGEKLASMAWDKVFGGRECSPEEVERDFNDYLCALVDTEYQMYLEHEDLCIEGIFEMALRPESKEAYPNVYGVVNRALSIMHSPNLSDRERLSFLTKELRPLYRFVEQSLAQGRMSRAGGSPQYHLKRLLKILGYEFETQCVLNGTVDFLFPSLEAWKLDRRRCVVLSVKRTLRERYKQVFEELGITRGITVYLMVTETFEEAEKDLTHSKVQRLDEQNVYLVVRDEIKRRRFPEASNVISFTTFVREELPAKRRLWQSLLRGR